MNTRIRRVEQVAVLDLSGALGAGESQRVLQEAVDRLLAADQKRIVLNLKRVPWIDSEGLGELVACQKRAEARDARIKLLNPAMQAFQVMALTRLNEYFDIYRSERDALASF